MAMKDNSKKVLNYLKEIGDAQVTAVDVAEAVGLTSRQVNGTFTSFQKKGYGDRIDAEIELEDGTHKKIKFLQLTDAGRAVDPDSDEA